MTHNLLEVPFKRTDPVDFTTCLSDLIVKQYTQPVDEFANDIARLHELRGRVTNASISSAGLSAYLDYYTQLSYLATKFPCDIGADFVWYDPSSKLSHVGLDDLSYEAANVLYNIAAIYAGNGLRENRSTAEGLKRAHQQFQVAAGCFTLLERSLETASFRKPEDLQAEYLACLRIAMLAQAQECIWQRAVLDHMKDKLIAQLSEQVSKFYQQALESLEKSTAISTSWAHHLSLKRYHFAAAAQVRMSSFALSANKYGEEVSRLRLAAEYCNKAQQHAPYVGKLVAQDLKGLTEHVKSTSVKAEKDNDMIYMIPVVSKDALPVITAQIMVKAVTQPELEDPLATIPEERLLFVSLVPIVVRNVVDIFEQRKEAIISREIANKLHALDLDMQALLQDLGLPGSLTVLEQPLGLPQGLTQQAEEIRRRGGSSYLQGLLDEVAALATANSELVEQIVDVMDEESLGTDVEQESASMAGYRSQIAEYSTFLLQAKTSDELVKAKVEQWKDQIDLLAGDESSLTRAIPSGQRVSLSRERESSARRVRICLNKWQQLSLERETHLDHVKTYASTDDITTDLIRHLHTLQTSSSSSRSITQADEFESVLNARLSRYDPFMGYIPTSSSSQESLMSELKHANAQFQASRTTTPGDDRERVLQDLDVAFHKYREVIGNLDEGARFYSDFHKALCRVADEVKAYVKREKDRERGLVNRVQQDLRTSTGVSDTVVGFSGAASPGTWRPESGITFGKSGRGDAQRVGTEDASSLATTRTLHVFDPSKHSIRFSSSLGQQ